MKQETKQYITRRIKLLDMKPLYLLEPGEPYFSPEVVNAFIERTNAGHGVGEADMTYEFHGLSGNDILKRGTYVDESRAALRLTNVVLQNGEVHADVVPFGPNAEITEAILSDLDELGLDLSKAIQLRTILVKEPSEPATAKVIITVDLHPKPLERKD